MTTASNERTERYPSTLEEIKGIEEGTLLARLPCDVGHEHHFGYEYICREGRTVSLKPVEGDPEAREQNPLYWLVETGLNLGYTRP